MATRRVFVKQMAQGNLMLLMSGTSILKLDGYLPFAGIKVDNPYEAVDWNQVQYVPSTSHIHVPDQKALDKAYHSMKLRHIPISNYYPSVPYYPLGAIREGQFQAGQYFGIMHIEEYGTVRENWTKAKFIKGPINWNKLIMDENTGWYKQLPQELQAQLPFKAGKIAFPDIPADVIISPNAEHHNFTNSPLHANSIGSLYSSGSFDAHNKFLTVDHGYNYGTGETWQVSFGKMLDKLLFKDGGGITVNHPTWSKLSYDTVCQMLDFDDRVLGIEIFNDPFDSGYQDPKEGWALELWDELLKSGRKCYGFCVPDHTINKGQNVLLVPEFNEHACLKAYRQGAFYGAVDGSGLRFNKISLEKDKLEISLNKQGSIRFITDLDQLKKNRVSQASFSIPMDNSGKPAITYVRVEAEDELGERIFSQPIRYIREK
jgi:hypothetical protein